MLGFRLVRAVTPTALAAAAAAFLAGCGASHQAASATTTRAKPAAPAKPRAAAPSTPAQRILGLPPVKPGPVPGYVLIADRNNNRILIVSPAKHVVWSFPRPGDIRPGQSFHDPDDAFFTPGYTGISINEEFNQTDGLISLRKHRIVWSYGRPGVAGSGAGLPLQPRRRLPAAERAVHGRRHPELPCPLRRPGPPRRARDRPRRLLRPPPAPGTLARPTAPPRWPTAACS